MKGYPSAQEVIDVTCMAAIVHQLLTHGVALPDGARGAASNVVLFPSLGGLRHVDV